MKNSVVSIFYYQSLMRETRVCKFLPFLQSWLKANSKYIPSPSERLVHGSYRGQIQRARTVLQPAAQTLRVFYARSCPLENSSSTWLPGWKRALNCSSIAIEKKDSCCLSSLPPPSPHMLHKPQKLLPFCCEESLGLILSMVCHWY